MDKNYIILASDDEIDVRSCEYSPMFGYLNIELVGLSLLDAVIKFSDKEATKKIQYFFDGILDKEYIGFTKLIMAKLYEESNNVLISLSRDFSL